ncbi:MAG: hypothetical protein AAF039_10935, partial [Bacteroidota bacterium]
MVFAHQDVYLPWGWDTQLRARITALEAVDPGWGVLGPSGLGVDAINQKTAIRRNSFFVIVACRFGLFNFSGFCFRFWLIGAK